MSPRGLSTISFPPITPRGESGFVTAAAARCRRAVVDSFGNVGVMYNRHCLEVVASTKQA